MASVPALDTFRRLLDAAGYHIEIRPELVIAHRAVDHRVVLLDAGLHPLRQLELWIPPEAVRRTVVYPREPGPEVREEAAHGGLEVLEPTTLGAALGEILLPPAPDDESSMGPTGELDPFDAPFPLASGEPRTIRARIDRTEAEGLAGLREARYTLRLIPYYVAAYRVRKVTADGSRGGVARKLVAVNATTRAVEFWEEGERELAGETAPSLPKLSPQLSEAGARPVAVEAIRRAHAGRVDHTEQHSGALVIETRRVLPPLEDVRVGPLNLLFVPFWYAEGVEGRVVLDAVSGQGAGTAGRP